MPEVFVTMAMSLDGFITGPHDDAQNPAGIDGMRLMDWLGGGDEDSANDPNAYRPKDPNSRIVFDEAMSSGAVVTGRRTGDFATTGAETTTTACRSSFQRTDRPSTIRLRAFTT